MRFAAVFLRAATARAKRSGGKKSGEEASLLAHVLPKHEPDHRLESTDLPKRLCTRGENVSVGDLFSKCEWEHPENMYDLLLLDPNLELLSVVFLPLMVV